MAERSPLDYGDRIGRLEGIIEQINDRLGSLEHRLGSVESSLEGRISSVESNLEGRISSVESSHRRDFRWLIGAMIGMWATMMGLLLTVTVKIFAS